MTTLSTVLQERAAGLAATVRLLGVTKTYHMGQVQVHALRDANLAIPAGKLLVILGPSGSGKTTLLNLLGGIDRATSGQIFIDGLEVTSLVERDLVKYRRNKVGFVFQFFNLIPSLTARENVELAGELVPDPLDPVVVLEKVGLIGRTDHFPAELSGGEQQRVAVARALVKNPPLLLCDEPTGELDYATGISVLEVISEACRADGRVVLLVTHNAVIADMADVVVSLSGGRVVSVVENPRPKPARELVW